MTKKKYLFRDKKLFTKDKKDKKARESEARKADDIIAAGIEAYHHQRRSLDAVSTVKAFRRKAERIRDAELERAVKGLSRGEDPERVLQALARNLTNKLIHSPSIQLKRASALGRLDVIVWSRELLEIPHPEEDDESSAGRDD